MTSKIQKYLFSIAIVTVAFPSCNIVEDNTPKILNQSGFKQFLLL